MQANNVRRLPAVNGNGNLAGMVSRRDLIRVFLRPGAEIAHQVGQLLAETLPTDPDTIQVAVHEGVVTLTGRADQPDLFEVAERLTRGIDSVVNVINQIGPAAPSHRQS